MVHVRALTYCDIHTINVEKLKEVSTNNSRKIFKYLWCFFFFLGFRVLPPLLSHILEKPLSLFCPLKTHCLCKGDRNPVVEKIENLFEVDKNTGMTSTLSKVSDKKVEKMLEDVTAWERPFTPNQVRFSSFPIFSLSIDFSFVFFLTMQCGRGRSFQIKWNLVNS